MVNVTVTNWLNPLPTYTLPSVQVFASVWLSLMCDDNAQKNAICILYLKCDSHMLTLQFVVPFSLLLLKEAFKIGGFLFFAVL